MKRFLKSALPDVLLIVGTASVTAGFWMIYPPAGYIMGGVLTLFAGVQLAKA